MTLTEPTKAEEIAQIEQLLSSVQQFPYLRAILKEAAPHIESAIRNDFGCIDLRTLEAQKMEAIADTRKLKHEQEQLAISINKLKREIEQHNRTLEEIRKLARRITG